MRALLNVSLESNFGVSNRIARLHPPAPTSAATPKLRQDTRTSLVACRKLCGAGHQSRRNPSGDVLTLNTLAKIGLRRSANRVKPAADIDLGMSFTAVMSGSGRFGGFRIPPVHRKIGISTSNHEPVDRIGGYEPADFTPEFLQRCHEFIPVYQGLVMLTS